MRKRELGRWNRKEVGSRNAECGIEKKWKVGSGKSEGLLRERFKWESADC
jgi:hypothetical protein